MAEPVVSFVGEDADIAINIRRERRRRDTLKVDKEQIVKRVLKFFDDDDKDRSDEKEARIQRYAKFRMWVEGKDWPWPDSSDVPLSDMMEKSLRMQDTLHNAVMSDRPAILGKARVPGDVGQQDTVNSLLDTQFFIEQKGEVIIGEIADDFINEGVFTVFVPWIKEMREVSDIRVYDAIPEELQFPSEYFRAILQKEFPEAAIVEAVSGEGWDWDVNEGEDTFRVKFYTRDNGRVEMTFLRAVEVYNGPRVIPKDWDEVLYPTRSANLQAPGPSNPNGAAHVILVDYPTIDEIRRLAEDGTYDYLTKEDLDTLPTVGSPNTNQEYKNLKDDLQGVSQGSANRKATDPEQSTLTRLMCFDVFDLDSDGIGEDVVWTVLHEPALLCRAGLMTEIFPSNPPRRPLAGSSFIPIKGRYGGISFLETLEGLHDVIKVLVDQAIDSSTLKITPFGFYRAAGGMKPEIIDLLPGELYPLNDPKRDIEFPNFSFNGEANSINMITLLTQWEERVSMVGELQLGRVPQGKSSALRTVGGMSMIAGQGEARPERILRRFFMGLADAFSIMHEQNRYFLPPEKKIRMVGMKSASADPYQTIKQRSEISSQMDFSFSANVLNTSKQQMQIAIDSLIGTYVNDLALNLGMIDEGGIYRLFREKAKAHGQDPDNYIKEPTPGSLKPRIFAEEAIHSITMGQQPDGRPAEAGGAIEHFQKLRDFFQSALYGLMTDQTAQEIFKIYLNQVGELAALQQQQQQVADSARAFQGGQQGGGQGGRPPEGPPPNNETPPISGGGELLDETLPGAGGGQGG
jgi:hypothetical protein